MIHSLLSAAAALVLLPASTAFVATLLRPQLGPVKPPHRAPEPGQWWKSLPCAALGVVSDGAQLTLTADGNAAVLSGSGGEVEIPVHRRADGLCAVSFHCQSGGEVECLLPGAPAAVSCPTGAREIQFGESVRIVVRAADGVCCIVWREN